MSSSLFYDCYAPYESYPYTEYLNGDKTFGDVGIHDVLYCLNEYNELTERTLILVQAIVQTYWKQGINQLSIMVVVLLVLKRIV